VEATILKHRCKVLNYFYVQLLLRQAPLGCLLALLCVALEVKIFQKFSHAKNGEIDF